MSSRNVCSDAEHNHSVRIFSEVRTGNPPSSIGGGGRQKPDNKPMQAISEQTASQLKDMLLNVVESGTGTNAKIPGMNVYGKTGTTSNSKDAWFCGFSDKYACVVWMGYDDGKSMGNIVGGTYPARLWRNIMSCV
ncbi:MAG: penicillin-binding protein [Thermoanaerobacterium sp.]|nr:penicillin-binding protein [Thermoanaerobacterium sp.]